MKTNEFTIKQQMDISETCWKGYTAKGMKKKGNKMVPNCVPVKEESDVIISGFGKMPFEMLKRQVKALSDDFNNLIQKEEFISAAYKSEQFFNQLLTLAKEIKRREKEGIENKTESSILKGIQKEDIKKAKDTLDKEINDMIQKIWQTEKSEMFQDSSRYLVYASDMGVEMDTDNLDDALETAEIIAKRKIRSPVVVIDKKTKFPVKIYRGSEDLWKQNRIAHEGYSAGAAGGAGLEESPTSKSKEYTTKDLDLMIMFLSKQMGMSVTEVVRQYVKPMIEKGEIKVIDNEPLIR